MDHASFDLEAYLERIGHQGGLDPTLETLRAIHLAHATSVPFENLDIQLGRPISLEMDRLQAKLVRDRRGGYCFEQNHLFMAALRAVGFGVTPLAARVRLGTTSPTPRTHMLLRVELEAESWIADVGFGADGLLQPIPLLEDAVDGQFGWEYRLIREPGSVWVLQSRRPDGWFDLYGFTEEPTPFVDYVMGNHFTSTHPQSPFVRNVIAQVATVETRLILLNRELREARPDGERLLATLDDDEMLTVLDERFGLAFAHGTRFRALVDPPAQEGPTVTA